MHDKITKHDAPPNIPIYRKISAKTYDEAAAQLERDEALHIYIEDGLLNGLWAIESQSDFDKAITFCEGDTGIISYELQALNGAAKKLVEEHWQCIKKDIEYLIS